jgi:hypothetical protein
LLERSDSENVHNGSTTGARLGRDAVSGSDFNENAIFPNFIVISLMQQCSLYRVGLGEGRKRCESQP